MMRLIRGIVSQATLTPLIDDSTKDGGFEQWLTATNAALWSEAQSGGSTVNQESVDPYEGTYCVRIDINGTNTYAAIQQNSLVTLGDVLEYEFWAKSNGGSWKFGGDAGADSTIITPGATWEKYSGRITITGASTKWLFARNSAAGFSLWVDSCKVWKVT